jgi:hypothetical protein
MQTRNGGAAFYVAFNNWKKKQIEKIVDEKERLAEDASLRNIFFPNKQKDRSWLKKASINEIIQFIKNQ